MTAIGFTERLVVRDEADPDFIHHAQLQWGESGGVMCGSDRDGGVGPRPGTACVNLVVPSDGAVDETLARAVAAGGTQISEVQDAPHGGRSVAVTDAEGNIFNIDSYPGV